MHRDLDVMYNSVDSNRQIVTINENTHTHINKIVTISFQSRIACERLKMTEENLQYLDSHIAPLSLICGQPKLAVENGCNVP